MNKNKIQRLQEIEALKQNLNKKIIDVCTETEKKIEELEQLK